MLDKGTETWYDYFIVKYKKKRANEMITLEAKRELNNLATTLKLSANGVTNVEMAVKGFRYSLTTARNYDGGFAKSEEYKQLEKHFSTFKLPKATEMKQYTETAIALIDKAMTA